MSLSRRDFVNRSTLVGAGVLIAGSAEALASAPGAIAAPVGGEVRDAATADAERAAVGYGALVKDPENLLALPKGFSYKVVNRAGVTKLRTGEFTPSNHDGTSAFEDERGGNLLVVNHELSGARSGWAYPVPLTEGHVYDPGAAAWLHHRARQAQRHGRAVGRHRRHLHQLRRWREPVGHLAVRRGDRGQGRQERLHQGPRLHLRGRPVRRRVQPRPQAREGLRPLRARGRRGGPEARPRLPDRGRLEPQRAAVPLDPATASSTAATSCASSPTTAGTLEAFKVFDAQGKFIDDLSRATKVGTTYGVDWVKVQDRDARTVSVRKQFKDGEVTRARKLEGMWWGDGGFYFVSSFARSESPLQHDGQVWFFNPVRRTITLKVLLGVNTDVWGDHDNFDGPDNITVSPYGGIVIAEDGEGVSHLFGATEDGLTYPIARNELNIGSAEKPEFSEFTGVTFSDDGKTLFANIQTPGIQLAITGPWHRLNEHKRGQGYGA